MPQKSTAEMMEMLFEQINAVIMPTDTSPDAPSPKGFVTLMIPGTTVRGEDFDLTTNTGKKNLYSFIDRIPALNKQFVDSSKKCSEMYKIILSAQTPEDDSQSAMKLKENYENAQKVLKSKKYRDYENFADNYSDAKDDYYEALNSPYSSDKEIRKAKRAMDRAFDDWVALGYKQEIEDCLDTCSKYLSFTPKSVYAQAGREFQKSLDLAVNLYPVTCIPSCWATKPDDLSWSKVIVKSNKSVSKIHHDVKQISSTFSANFASGLWHASASGGYNERVEKLNTSADVENLGFSFEIARVDIIRDWFSGSLLNYNNVYIPGRARGSVCSGSLKDASKCDFPYMPTSFVVAKNINIYNKFTSEELNFITEAKSWSVNASIGYGPFEISNNTSSSHDMSDEEKKEFAGSVKITVGEGMQIIGFLNSLLTPAFPAIVSNETAADIGLLQKIYNYKTKI